MLKASNGMKELPSEQGVIQAHALIELLGPERGLQKATEDGLDERLIRILEDFYARPSGRLGIQFSGWSFLSLPHKALPPEQKWERTLHTDGLTCSLIVEPGELIIDGKPQSFGVPFGPTARLILLFLQTQALEQRSREIEVGNTTYAWLRRLGLSVGGQDYRRFREQMMRLMTCSVRFLYENRQENGARISGFTKNPLIESGVLSLHAGDRQMNLWGDRVVLSENFYKALIEHPVPIDMYATRRSCIRPWRSTSMAGFPTACMCSSDRRPSAGPVSWRSSASATAGSGASRSASARRWSWPCASPAGARVAGRGWDHPLPVAAADRGEAPSQAGGAGEAGLNGADPRQPRESGAAG
jgi:hypothetical protein